MSRNFEWPMVNAGPIIGSVKAGSFWPGGEAFSVDDVSLDPFTDRTTDVFLGYRLCTNGLYPSAHWVVQR